jgi:hypothetical protein
MMKTAKGRAWERLQDAPVAEHAAFYMVNWTSHPSKAQSIVVIKLHSRPPVIELHGRPLVVVIELHALTQGDGGKERSRQELKHSAPYDLEWCSG